MGIDPGTTILGYAIIEVEQNKIIQLDSVGVVQLHKYGDHYTKLKKIFEKVSYLIDTYRPTELAIEAPFYGENVQSMLKLGRAQGVAITAAMLKNVPVEEYSPRKIKQSITGNGNASKEQVAAMLKQMLYLDVLPSYFDATDALGVAVCHHLQNRLGLKSSRGKTGSGGGQYKDWKEYLKENPDKKK